MHNLKLISFNMLDSLEGLGLSELTSLRERVIENDPDKRADLIRDLRLCGLAMSRQMLERLFEGGNVEIILQALPGAEEPWMPNMVDVPGGSFKMGGTKYDDEKPIRDVTLSDYRIGRDPVTNAEYAKFMGDGGYTKQEYWSGEGWAWKDRQAKAITGPKWWKSGEYNSGVDYPNHPVVGISWYEAQAYCRWLAEKKGTDVRLATEAEWEYAARGPDSREYPWVDGEGISAWDASRCNFNSSETTEVGIYPKGESWCGARDMSGNVWERLGDWYREEGYDRDDTNNPTGSTTGRGKVLRGGSWYDDNPGGLRSAYRDSYHPEYRSDGFVGFRVAEGKK
ncbi:MAG: formylglycine-generating enzyme family protein [Candidatus Saganbacteria bacterium]|nr:formylglycine-generating enzyme family protein [Candidatus Saganbacteria bacterium]